MAQEAWGAGPVPCRAAPAWNPPVPLTTRHAETYLPLRHLRQPPGKGGGLGAGFLIPCCRGGGSDAGRAEPKAFRLLIGRSGAHAQSGRWVIFILSNQDTVLS